MLLSRTDGSLSAWCATQRVMKSALRTAGDLARAEVHVRLSGQPEDVWRGRYQAWARQILNTYGLKISLHGPLPTSRENRATLLLCAHRSPLDVAVLVSMMPELRFLSRADVEHWLIVGGAARRARTLFVERGNRKSAVRAVEQMRGALRAGDALAVFPEGKTKTSSQLGMFRSGAFRAQVNLDVDVWLVAMDYPQGFGWRPGGQGLFAHLREVAARGETHVNVGFEKLPSLPENPVVAARVSRKKLQDLEDLLRTQRAG